MVEAAGQGLGTVTAQSRVKRIPPSGTQATAVTTGSFYSLPLYTHGIKPAPEPPAPGQCQHRPGTAMPQQWLHSMDTSGLSLTHGGQTHAPISIPRSSRWQGWPGASPYCSVKHLGWIHPCIHRRDGERASITAQGWRLLVCKKSPRNPGSQSLV